MAEKKKYNSILISGRKDQTLTYSKYVKDEESGESVKESLDKKVNVTDELTTQQIKDGAITNEKMAADSVGNTNLQDGSVSNEKLKDESITNEKLAENSITKDKLKDNTIGVEKLDPELRQTINAATGLPENLVKTIQNVDDTLKDHQSQLDDKQSQIDDKQQQITANDEDISLLQTRSTQMEETIKSIAATGGASQATAVTYDNEKSGLDAVNIQSAIDEIINNLGHYETNEEWLRTYTDTEGKFLWGIRVDGSIDWSVGIPTPIRTKLQEIVTKCQQDKTDLTEAIATAKKELISSLQTYQQTTDASIAKLQEGKVDKEEGKSLIEDEVKECFRVIVNEEFIKAIVDAEDKVLFGFYRATGKPYYPLNEMYHVEQNEEFFALWQDSANHVLLGIRRDGQIIGEIHAVNALKKVISQLQSDVASLQEKVGTIDTNLKELLDVFSLQENPEYLAVEKDAEGKILSSTNPDGSHYIHKVKSETIPTEFEHIEDPEGRTEITTDAENKVMSYRDSSGKKHEHDMEIANLDVSNINLQGNSVNNIQDALNANGFNVKTPIDWSDSSFIQISEPRLAFVNITNINSMPTNKTQNMHAIFEFWDMQGNYFRKKVILNAQGNSSLGMPKKNFACDFYNDDWVGDDTFKIKIGSWVPQDSFHFKAFYADFFKGVSMVGYKLFNEIESTRSSCTNRVWKRALLPSADTIGYGVGGLKSIEDVNILIDNGARCYPDGFPCIVHLNGSFYGIFSWALKKHRDNYMQNKSKPENIQLDGDIYDTFSYNGNIDWDVVSGNKEASNTNMDGVEFRNPKSLICFDGTKYDGDTNRKELIDSLSEHYDASNKNHVITSKVKAYYTTLTTYIPTLKKMEEQSEETFVIKSKIQSFFDVDSLMDYLIFSDVVTNTDGFRKNWQWVTYNGIKWAVCPYDLDGIFGWNGWSEQSPTMSRLGDNLQLPTGWVIKYFEEELRARYRELRVNILTKQNILTIFCDWCSRIGASNYDKDLSKWPQTPELYPPFGSKHIDNIYRVENWLNARLKKCDEIYKYNN